LPDLHSNFADAGRIIHILIEKTRPYENHRSIYSSESQDWTEAPFDEKNQDRGIDVIKG
jgi:spore coat polysaccharide biosynthesis protein SpsF (cytidylyltransferase family)